MTNDIKDMENFYKELEELMKKHNVFIKRELHWAHEETKYFFKHEKYPEYKKNTNYIMNRMSSQFENIT